MDSKIKFDIEIGSKSMNFEPKHVKIRLQEYNENQLTFEYWGPGGWREIASVFNNGNITYATYNGERIKT